MKRLTALSILVILWGWLLTPLMMQAQISPGDLSEVHAHLEGLSNCTLCHELGQAVTNEKCLDCHKEINSRVSAGEGFHSSKGVRSRQCVACHNDHHGRKFQIIRFDTDTFNHDLTGWTLKGSHMKLKCEKCHTSEFIQDKKLQEKKTTWLGLSTQCAACHEDIHQGTLENDCARCHNEEKFKPATGFDHARTDYPLTGKHADVACVKCHPLTTRNNKDFTTFKGVSHALCTDCHTDPHNGRMGTSCTKCHSTASFTVVAGGQTFDHSRTRFPLKGSHATVACENCHKGKLTDPVRFAQCTDCHTDYHRGQLVKAGQPFDCDQCHTEATFKGSSYTLDLHQRSDFPLEGAHMATPCFVCHVKGDRWEFKQIGKNCADCHDDIHRDIIDPKYYPEQSCDRCHTTELWSRVQFDHKATQFDLTGAHMEVSCRACHFKTLPDATTVQSFKGLEMACTQCHEDQHGGQFEKDGLTDCTRCHQTARWKPVDFNHDLTRFPLDGKHNKVACAECHKAKVMEGRTIVQYKLETLKCEDCHH